MARQVRSQVTRRKLLDAAIDVFSEVGPTAAARIAITERAGMTKGALYYHFDSMESLLSAIIDDGSTTVLNSFQAMCAPPSPALEGMIHGMFAVDDVLAGDKRARVAEHLVFALGGFNDSAAAVYNRWLTEVAAQTKRAVVEGDVREELNPDTVSESIVGAMFGTRLLPQETPQSAVPGRLTRMWDLLLPAVTTDASLPYFREFLARETLRYQSSRTPG